LIFVHFYMNFRRWKHILELKEFENKKKTHSSQWAGFGPQASRYWAAQPSGSGQISLVHRPGCAWLL
jgi:hypothetical protein